MRLQFSTLVRLGMSALHRARMAYWALRKPGAEGVHGIVLTPAGAVVLVRHTYLPGWHLPGGGLRRGEAPEVGMLRELREEIGLQRHAGIEKVDSFVEQHGHRTVCVHVFLLRGAIYRPRMSLEIAGVIEAQLSELPANAAVARMRLISAGVLQ